LIGLHMRDRRMVMGISSTIGDARLIGGDSLEPLVVRRLELLDRELASHPEMQASGERPDARDALALEL